MHAGLRKPEELITIVVMLLTYGCPPQAIVWAFGLDERTVANWQIRAGKQGKIEVALSYLLHDKATPASRIIIWALCK